MIRTAILGMGIRGEMYANGLRQNPAATLVGCCDINTQVLKAAEAKWRTKGYADFTTLMDESTPDAVIICTPDFAHLEPALEAASRGIHLLVEKPLATTVTEAERIVEAVKANQVICQVAFENRWNPPFVQVKNAIERGELGDISLVNASLNDTLWVPTEMISWAASTTVGWFLLPHVLDLTIWLSGKSPRKVYAVANKTVLPAKGIDTYDSIITTVTFKGGMQAIFENAWILPQSSPAVYDFRFNIIGEKGAVKVNTQDQMIHQFTESFSYPSSLFLEIHGHTRGFPLYMLDSFLESVQEGVEPLATVEDGFLITQVIEAVHKSIYTGQPVVLAV